MRWSDTTISNGMIRRTIHRTIPDDDNQQGNAQPAQNNATQANDNRNVLRSDVYADVK